MKLTDLQVTISLTFFVLSIRITFSIYSSYFILGLHLILKNIDKKSIIRLLKWKRYRMVDNRDILNELRDISKLLNEIKREARTNNTEVKSISNQIKYINNKIK